MAAAMPKRRIFWLISTDFPCAAQPLYLPSHSTDFNPIENLLAKIKALFRKKSARIIDIVTPTECQNMFAAGEYHPDLSNNAHRIELTEESMPRFTARRDTTSKMLDDKFTS